jgi:hypothetical protein
MDHLLFRPKRPPPRCGAVLHNLCLRNLEEGNTGSYTVGIGDGCAVIPLAFRTPRSSATPASCQSPPVLER